MIKLQVIGHLGKDCLLNTVNGKNVINFTVAHSERFKDATGAQKERTIWVDCAYWTEKTGIAPYLKKGTLVYVEGAPDVRVYQTQDGRNGASITLRVMQVQLLGGKPEQTEGNHQPQSQSAEYAHSSTSSPLNETSEPVDDLPF